MGYGLSFKKGRPQTKTVRASRKAFRARMVAGKKNAEEKRRKDAQAKRERDNKPGLFSKLWPSLRWGSSSQGQGQGHGQESTSTTMDIDTDTNANAHEVEDVKNDNDNGDGNGNGDGDGDDDNDNDNDVNDSGNVSGNDGEEKGEARAEADAKGHEERLLPPESAYKVQDGRGTKRWMVNLDAVGNRPAFSVGPYRDNKSEIENMHRLLECHFDVNHLHHTSGIPYDPNRRNGIGYVYEEVFPKLTDFQTEAAVNPGVAYFFDQSCEINLPNNALQSAENNNAVFIQQMVGGSNIAILPRSHTRIPQAGEILLAHRCEVVEFYYTSRHTLIMMGPIVHAGLGREMTVPLERRRRCQVGGCSNTASGSVQGCALCTSHIDFCGLRTHGYMFDPRNSDMTIGELFDKMEEGTQGDRKIVECSPNCTLCRDNERTKIEVPINDGEWKDGVDVRIAFGDLDRDGYAFIEHRKPNGSLEGTLLKDLEKVNVFMKDNGAEGGIFNNQGDGNARRLTFSAKNVKETENTTALLEGLHEGLLDCVGLVGLKVGPKNEDTIRRSFFWSQPGLLPQFLHRDFRIGTMIKNARGEMKRRLSRAARS